MLRGRSRVLSGEQILARLETETNRRHALLKEYSFAAIHAANFRFGKQAASLC
jgi:hypothetical protein